MREMARWCVVAALGICLACDDEVKPDCIDATKNGSETDLDCGGSCPPCEVGQRCVAAADCESGVCQGGTCQLPGCTDGVKNGVETDTDCGGTCVACVAGAQCLASSDCDSSVCLGGTCQMPTCLDQAHNGTETDQDCGGLCPPCADGAHCGLAADCVGGFCIAGTCSGPPMGLLQLSVEHNLTTNACLGNNSCYIRIDEEQDTGPWLAGIEAVSSLAVFHWVGAVPWLAFDQDLPAGESRVAYYDNRLDTKLRDRLNRVATHFAALPVRYLALTPLDNSRTQLAPLRVAAGNEATTTSACPVLVPGATLSVTYNPGTGPVLATFSPQRAYLNFVKYMVDKLRPDYLALIEEANKFQEVCPAAWTSLVTFYHGIYDSLRASVPSTTKMFVTLVYRQLLAFNAVDPGCFGQLYITACNIDPTHIYPAGAVDKCFPLNTGTIQQLDAGGRLDVLALSYYPDDFMMAVPGSSEKLLRAYPLNWDGVADCLWHTQLYPFLDPLEQLQRLGWTKPIAIAESATRSCPILLYKDEPTPNPDIFLQLPGSSGMQAFWLDRLLSFAREHHLEFVVGPFFEDYPPMGRWIPTEAPQLLSAFNSNIYACMGVMDELGQSKGEVTDLWLESLTRP